MKSTNYTLGQTAALRFGGFVVLAVILQLSAYFTQGGTRSADMLMTVLTALMALVLYNIAKNKNYSQAVIIFIIIFLNVIGVGYMLMNILENRVDLGDILALSLITVYSYHQAGFLINTNFLWAMVTLNVGLTLWPALFLRPVLADPEAPFIASVLYLVATTIIITLKNNQDSTHREISYKLELNSTQEQLTAKQAELSTTQTQLTTAQTKLAHTQSHLADIQSQLTTCHTQQRNDHNQLKAYEAEIATLKQHLESKNTKIEQQQAQINTLQQQLIARQTEHLKDQKQLSMYKAEITSYKKALKTKEEQLTQSNQTLACTDQHLKNRLKRISEIEEQLEKFMSALFNQEVERVYGIITNQPKPFKQEKSYSLFWIQSERHGKIPVCYPVSIEQAIEEGIEIGKRMQAVGSIKGYGVSVAHAFVVLMAWNVLIEIDEEDLQLSNSYLLE